MKRMRGLVCLRAETVRELRELASEVAAPSLDELVGEMINCFRDHRRRLQNEGWISPDQGGQSAEGRRILLG